MSGERVETPRRRPVDGEVTLNGSIYVPDTAYRARVDEADRWRRTLALAHMHLVYGDANAALAVIQRDTGDTRESARAVRDVVAWALTGGAR